MNDGTNILRANNGASFIKVCYPVIASTDWEWNKIFSILRGAAPKQLLGAKLFYCWNIEYIMNGPSLECFTTILILLH